MAEHRSFSATSSTVRLVFKALLPEPPPEFALPHGRIHRCHDFASLLRARPHATGYQVRVPVSDKAHVPRDLASGFATGMCHGSIIWTRPWPSDRVTRRRLTTASDYAHGLPSVRRRAYRPGPTCDVSP